MMSCTSSIILFCLARFWARIAEQPFFQELAIPEDHSVNAVAAVCQAHFKLDSAPLMMWRSRLVKVVEPDYEIDIVPLHHTLYFEFRSVTGRESLRALAKKTTVAYACFSYLMVLLHFSCLGIQS